YTVSATRLARSGLEPAPVARDSPGTRSRFSAWVEVDAWHGWAAAVPGLRATLRDLRLRRVGEPRKRAEREHATLSLGRAGAELAERGAHVASENAWPGVGLDDDDLVPVRVPGRRQQADPRQHLGFALVLDVRRAVEVDPVSDRVVLERARVGELARL